jgi:hypothetical protein
VARAIGNDGLFLRAALGYGGVLQAIVHPDPRAQALLEKALDRVDKADSAARVMALARLAHWLQNVSPYSERLELSNRAVAMARDAGDRRALATVLLHRYWALDGPGDVGAALRVASEILDIGAEFDDPELTLEGLRIRLDVQFEHGERSAAVQTARDMKMLAQKVRHPEFIRLADMWAVALADAAPPRDVFATEPHVASASTLPITIYLADGANHEQVEASVEELIAHAGLEITGRDEPVIGSWFRKLRAGVRQTVTSQAAREAALTAAHVADSRLVLAQDAQITATLLANLGPVITSLQCTKDAVLRVGALLIVKIEWQVQVFQLTAAQQAILDHRPHLSSSPGEIIAALQLFPPEEDGHQAQWNE